MAASEVTSPGWVDSFSHWWYGTEHNKECASASRVQTVATRQLHLPHLPHQVKLWSQVKHFEQSASLKALAQHVEQVGKNSLRKWVDKELKKNIDSKLTLSFLQTHSVSEILTSIAIHKLSEKALTIILPPHIALTAILVEEIYSACKMVKGIHAAVTEPEAAKLITKKEMTHLDLRCSPKITDEEFVEIINANPQLESLDISNCYRITKDGIAALKTLENLHELKANGCQAVSSEGWQLLPTTLVDLELKDCAIDDAAVVHIANMSALEHLNLNCNMQLYGYGPKAQLSKESLALLATNLGHLQALGVSGLYRSHKDSGLQALATSTSISTLDISYNWINGDIMTALGGMESLRYLNLVQTERSDDSGIKGLADSKIEGLDARYISGHWHFTLDDLKAVPKGIKELGYDTMRDSDVEAQMAVLGEFTELESLLSTPFQVTAESVKNHWSNITKLRELSPRAVTDDALSLICAQNPGIEVLSLVGCTDTGIQAAAEKLTAIRSINVRGCYTLTDASIVALTAKPHPIETIHADMLTITATGVDALTKMAVTLQTLWLAGIDAPVASAEKLTQCKKLQDFSCYYFSWPDGDAYRFMTAMPNLTSFTLANAATPLDQAIQYVSQCKNLNFLNLLNIPASDDSILPLGDSHSIRSLNFAYLPDIDDGIQSTVLKMTQLTGILVQNCPKITQEFCDETKEELHLQQAQLS